MSTGKLLFNSLKCWFICIEHLLHARQVLWIIVIPGETEVIIMIIIMQTVVVRFLNSPCFNWYVNAMIAPMIFQYILNKLLLSKNMLSIQKSYENRTKELEAMKGKNSKTN